MSKNPPMPKTFRAVMQRLGMSKVRNSPVRRVESAAVKKVKKGDAVKVNGVAAEATAQNSANPTKGKREDDPVNMFFEALQTPVAITDQLRFKGQEAMRVATMKATQVLEAAKENTRHRTAAPPPSKESPHVKPSCSSTPSTASQEGSAHTFDPEAVIQRFRKTVKETKKDYYSRVPFDERWDGIMGSLAVLGRTSTGNRVTPYRDSGEAFAHMWKAVDAAEKEVLWQTYICKDDYVGQRTVHKLAEAKTKRNCKTELLYDCGGNISGRSRLTEELKQCGATVIPYRPFFHSFLEYVFKGFDWRISPGLRNHRKILLVDGRIGFCGGLNVGNEYCGTQEGGSGKFRDTHCAVVGPAVAHLREVYDDTKEPRPWKYSWARWRQIATTQLNRGYETGKHVVAANVLRPLQSTTKEVKQRGGVYFRQKLRYAEDNTHRVLQRMRWQKQQRQREKCERWKDRQSGTEGNGSNAKGVVRQTASGVHGVRNQETETLKVAGSDEKHSVPPTVSATDPIIGEEAAPTTTPPPLSLSAASTLPPSSETPDVEVLDGNESRVSDGRPHNRTGVMRRKVTEARIRALYNATDLPHKRSYTALLLGLPISDNEPVPEAEMYCLRRPSTTQIVSCNPRWRDYSIQYAFWQVTRKCHRRIWITTPYYLPTKKLFRALVHAASRGVDVRILSGSNQTTDPWFMWHASNYITERLLRSGVKIYEYKGTQIMHAKTVVADSVWSSIGSYNWDVMSNKNLEVCLCQLDLDLAREMEKQFLQDLAMSEEVNLEEHRQRGLLLRFTSWIFYNVVFILDKVTFRSFANQDLEDSTDTHRD